MNISVIFTGGTISSKTSGSSIQLSDAPYELLDAYKDSDIVFSAHEPYSILSEELTPHEMRTLAMSVKQHYDDSDAVIVVHGTDTLIYSAAFLAYLFEPARRPVLLVGSGYPLDDERANGRQNFKAAVSLAMTAFKGVAVPYYQNGQMVIHHGSRIFRQRPYDDMLFSAGNSALSMNGGGFSGLKGFLAVKRGEAVFRSLADSLDNNTLSGFGRTMYLKCLPGMYYPELSGDIGGVILESYHSGTLCADERFAAFLKAAAALGIPVFVAGAGGRDADYETVGKYRALGAIPLPCASPDAMYIKLCLALSMGGDAVKTMLTPCAGDIIL